MTNFEILKSPEDDRIAALIDEVYAEYPTEPRCLTVLSNSTPYDLARMQICQDASSMLAVKALSSGIYAAREEHYGHFIVSFGDPEQKPQEDDLVACLSWGQFSDTYKQTVQDCQLEHRPAYIGPRYRIADLGIPGYLYENGFSSKTVRAREHTFMSVPLDKYCWILPRSRRGNKTVTVPGEMEYSPSVKQSWRSNPFSCRLSS